MQQQTTGGKPKFQPTHFIEQYVLKYSREVNSTCELPMASLSSFLRKTAELPALKTIAIFKIQYKPQTI